MRRRQETVLVGEESIVGEEDMVKPAEKSVDGTERGSELEQLPGVGAATAEKLMIGGYDTMLGIAVATPGELVELTGVTELAARKMIQFARDKLEMGFVSAEDVLVRRQGIEKINSGSTALDGLMGGGFETGAIAEAYGAYGSGKTQLAHTLTVNCIRQYPESCVIYIDTESTFRPERIVDIAKAQGLEPEKVLKQIKVARAFNSDHQMLLAEKVEDLIKKQGLKVKLVIVDSLTAHFRAEFIGRGTLADRQQKINKHMHTLMRLAELNNLCVYVTNQVMSKPDVFFGDPTEAIGGHVVAHASTYRIYLRRGKKGTRVAKMIDSPSLPEGEATFVLDTAGVRDV
ncbi:DNA repair and recombination protein RadA [Candidatus Woesearchaeota archaeon]|nr:DNA repair and recombination protein RadA [Candidatus Woesearchaeota archaeon]